MANYHQGIDMALREKTKSSFGESSSWRSQRISPRFLKSCDLHGIRNDIAMGNHHSFLDPDKSATYRRYYSLSLTGNPDVPLE